MLVAALGSLHLLRVLVAPPALSLRAPDSTRVIRYEFSVAAPVADVWTAVSTTDGLRTFFSSGASIELVTFGHFVHHFTEEAPSGKADLTGNLVLAVQPDRLLTFTWDAPPKYPSVRAQRTVFEIRLAPDGAAQTRVTFTQSGFGNGGEWDGTFEYFRGGWALVAAALQYRFDVGPINWAKGMPDLLPRMKAIDGNAAVAWAKQHEGK
jgi:uncharacterized protein YndB with AHSA1/START domain